MRKVLASAILVLVASFGLSTNLGADSHQRRDVRAPQVMPVFGGMRAEMEAQFEVIAQPKTAERLAAFTRNYFESLQRAGFSEGQALELVKAMGFPRVFGPNR